ncbi:hypothetical protein PpBr36_07612 [Pyricularia pennisetigena]|uniref:hypothetical protein n=1 Tax=Pyricularia pennisetigena TaxID=1578925 RepID=UPI00114E066C|nr:hypothetical protein PpBr36_07612 [Pyricularia pennisetigena]TLS25664.1 hypothetical protein PpBr36_07612 [Pyricularia pennisetigena]
MSPAIRPWRSQYQNWKVSRRVGRAKINEMRESISVDLTVPKLKNVSRSILHFLPNKERSPPELELCCVAAVPSERRLL